MAEHLLNGMFYELYFDSRGEFRGNNLKGQCMRELFAIQTVQKYKDSIAFIRQALAPYRDSLAMLPSATPEIVELNIKVAKRDPPVVRSIECMGKQVLVDATADTDSSLGQVWRLSFRQFSLETLRESISDAWHVPLEQLRIEITPEIRKDMQFRLPEGKTIGRPWG
jgi:hypothetical protein